MIIQDGANYQKVPAEKKRLEIWCGFPW
jgi:hypothetical protein